MDCRDRRGLYTCALSLPTYLPTLSTYRIAHATPRCETWDVIKVPCLLSVYMSCRYGGYAAGQTTECNLARIGLSW